MQFQPGGLVGGDPEGEGVGFGKHVEAIEFFEDFFRGFLADTPILGPFKEFTPVLLDEFSVVLSAESTPHEVGLAGGKASDIYRQLVHLVLKQDHAQSTLKCMFLKGMVVDHRSFAVAPSKVFLNTVVDAHAWPYRTYLVSHVKQVLGPKPGYGLHLS